MSRYFEHSPYRVCEFPRRDSVLLLVAPTWFCAALTLMSPSPSLGNTLDELVQAAFACGITSVERAPQSLGGKRYSIEGWGVSLWLPDRWSSPRVTADRLAECQSPDNSVAVRISSQPLGDMTLDEVVTTYERAYFGENQAVGDCYEVLLDRYQMESVKMFAFGMYRSTIPLRHWHSSYVIYAVRESRAFVLEVAANWRDNRPPPTLDIDSILAGFSVR